MEILTTRFITIDENVAEIHRIRGEQSRQARAKRDAARSDKSHGKVKIPMRDREFIVWDGEGPQDTGYSLLGNSKGEEICYPHLRTRDCLNLLLDSGKRHPNSIHVGFGFNYDVSCMLWELSWRHLTSLYKFNRTVWRDYIIEHIPRKWFRIKRGNVSIKIFDVHSFFNSSLVGALEEWRIGPWQDIAQSSVDHANSDVVSVVPSLSIVQTMTERQLVETFKKLRSEFLWKDIQQIAIYMRLELKYTKILMGKLRESLIAANYVPRSWHGPGAVARMAFNRHGIYDVLIDTPEPVGVATRYAFIAGRFELFKAGRIGRVYTADINSAYPWFCSQLPNLAKGTWRQTNQYEPGKFGVYRIRYEGEPNAYGIHPLPFRDKHNMIVWPHRVTGWYWNPEADLVADSPYAEFLDGWIFDEDDPTDRPFSWIPEYFDLRRMWKDEHNPAQYALKLILNSIYGQLAQRAGWDKKNKKAPKTHQLEFAGWITSSCRAAVYNVAKQCGHSLVSIDTDGVTSTAPFSWLTNSKELGGWELDEYEDSIYWQSGIYTLKGEDGWKKARTRGIPKGTYEVDVLFACLQAGTPLKISKKVFMSYGLAISQGSTGRSKLNQWESEPHVYEMGGAGKRFHYKGGTKRTTGCHTVCPGNGIHLLALPSLIYRPGENPVSRPHRLPWIDAKDDMAQKDYLTNLVLFDTQDLDQDDEWAVDYAEW